MSLGQRPAAIAPRPTLGWRDMALGILAAVPLAFAHAPASGDPAGASLRWDRHAEYRHLLAESPDSARALADRLIAADEHDFMGRWLHAAWASAADSSAKRATLTKADASPEHAGLQVEAGTLRLVSGDVAGGRAAFDRAARGYAAADRDVDAAWAAIWKIIKRRDVSERASLRADVAQADSLARVAADPATRAAALNVRGFVARATDNRAAMRMQREALATAPPEALRLRSDIQLELAVCLKTDGDLTGAETSYTAALNLGREAGDGTNEREALVGLAQCARGRGEFEACETLLQQALAVALRNKSARGASVVYGEQGALYLEFGHFDQARERLLQNLALVDSLGDFDDKVVTLDGLGALDALTGHYDAARARFEEAMALCQSKGLERRLPFVMLHSAELHQDMGDPETALALIERGLVVARKTGHRRAEVLLLSERGDVLRRLDRLDEALRAVREAKALARDIEPRRIGTIARTEALTLYDMRRNTEALAVLDTAIAETEARRDSSSLGRLVRMRGTVLQERDPKAALPELQRARAIADSLDSPSMAADAELSLGSCELAVGRPYDAIVRLESGLAWFENARSGVRTSEERSGFQDLYYDFYTTLALAYARAGQRQAAFATLERSRARELRLLFGSRPARALEGVPAESRRELDQVEADLSALQGRILQEYARPARERSLGLPAMEVRADSLKKHWHDLSLRLERSSPEFARHDKLSAPMSPRDVQARLQPGERLLAFMIGIGGSLAFDVRRDRIAVRELAWTERDVAGRVEQFTGVLRSGAGGDGWRARAASLADTLLGAGILGGGATRLYVIPDGALHYLPFEALLPPAANGAPRQTLAERCEVVYATSATLLFAPPLGAAKAGVGPVVAFGDPTVAPAGGAAGEHARERGTLPAIGPLPHARREAQDIAALFPGSTAYVGADASEARFFDEIRRARTVHVAAHAFVDDRHPTFSGIVLAPGSGPNRSDGLVQAYEVLQSRCNLELATLSACETAGGTLRRGEGILGLSRAFQLAGARHLVVSLWKVDDAATADFMRAFYQRLEQGASAAGALRDAKRSFLASSGAQPPDAEPAGTDRGVASRKASEFRSAPSTWAAFVLLASRER